MSTAIANRPALSGIDPVASTFIAPEPATRPPDFLGYVPCPIRTELRRRLARAFRYAAPEPVWHIAPRSGDPDPYDDLWRHGDANTLPGLITEVGFGNFLRPAFASRWLDTGFYEAPARSAAGAQADVATIRPEFREAGLVDPRGIFQVYAAFPCVILADPEKLRGRPLPATWADLLHPRYRGDVILHGSDDTVHEIVLFNLWRDHGEAGLAALAANVRDFWSPARIVATAGAGDPSGAALYVLPLAFARDGARPDNTVLVWPAEGAWCMPMYLFARRDRRLPVRYVLDFFAAPEWSYFLAHAGFPPAVAPAHPAPPLLGKLRWPGWEFVRTRNLEALRAPLQAAFRRGRSRKER
ncbi:hypothetical protein OPIT5_01730 [Opitutaceae bacterium TAV5]|nr:hypothetical protein OPIT5_01730 [Opitutaceae bacterium TAV5]